jgi:hypothetical protein
MDNEKSAASIFMKTNSHRIRSLGRFLRKVAFWVLLPAAFFYYVADAIPAYADIAHTVGYQGRLKNSSGNPLSGTYTFTFRLYDVASGGTSLWSETQTGVQTSDGFFAVRLGSISAFPVGFDFNRPLYLSTEVNGDGEMSPRVAVNSVAYAYTAEGVGSYGVAPTNATGGRLYYNTSNNGLYYYDQGASSWVLLGTSTGTFQSITNAGNVTTNGIQFNGGTSTGALSVTDITGNNATFTNLNVSNFNPTALTFTNGTSTSWLGFSTASGTSLFATNATFATATVMGQAVCLANGTGCPTAAEHDTLATVSARGAFATTTLQLYGGFLASSSTVTSTLTVLGATSLGTLTGSNANTYFMFFYKFSQMFVVCKIYTFYICSNKRSKQCWYSRYRH